MKHKIFLLVLLFFVPIASHAQVDSVITVDGMERSYTVYVPQNYDEAVASPLVIVLHGSGGNGATSMVTTEFASLSETNGTILVYPNGYNLHWDFLDKNEYAPDADVADDVLFINTLIDELASNYNIDRSRIYVTGISSGGYMALRLMCELPIAGVAIISATATPELANHCLSLEKPIDTLIILGTEDSSFPVNGLAYVDDDGLLDIRFSFAQLTGFLSTLFHCDTGTDVVRIDDDSSDKQVVRETRNNCGSAQFEMIYILKHNHMYPTEARLVLKNRTVGTVDEYIWEFFGLSNE